MEEYTKNSLVRQIDLISILYDVVREWWVILLLSVSVSLFANIYVNETYQPIYTTKTTFAVTTKGANSTIYQNLTSAKELANRFTQILDSNLLKKTVAKDLGMDAFRATTSATQITETNLVELKVTASSAMEAFQVLNSIMENYGEVSDYVIGNVILEVIQAPTIPMGPSNSVDAKAAMKKAFLVTAVLVVVYLMAFSYFRDTVKNPQQMTEKVDAKYLGTVYHEKKGRKRFSSNKNVSMLIDNSTGRSFGFVESNRMVASRVRSHLERKNSKTFIVTSVMEDEGKSTVAANIALALAQEGKKVLLVDCDFRKPSQYKIFGIEEKDGIQLSDILNQSPHIQQLAKRYKNTSLYMMFNDTPIRVDGKLSEKKIVSSIMEAYREEMDFIILDTAPMALVSDTEELAQLVDASILVVREDMVLAKNINDAIDFLNRTNGKVLGCIFNNATKLWSIHSSYSGYGNYGGYYGKRTK